MPSTIRAGIGRGLVRLDLPGRGVALRQCILLALLHDPLGMNVNDIVGGAWKRAPKTSTAP